MKKANDSQTNVQKIYNQTDEPRKILTLSGLKDPKQMCRHKK